MSNQTAQPSRTAGIEKHSIDYVPLSERHGKVWHQGPFWFTGNFVLSTLVVGFVGPTLGLSVFWTIVAVVFGVVVGTFFMAFHANQGPRMGLPQMIQSRAQFGSRGAILPLLATVFVYVGFIIFGLVFATESLNTVLPGNKFFWYPVLGIIAVVIAIIGHDLLHFIQRWMAYVMVVAFGIFTVLAIVHFQGATPVLAGGFSFEGVIAMFSIAAGYQISYAVYVSDYSRYLPENTPASKVIGWTFLGAALSAIWLMALGALLASYLKAPEAVHSLVDVGNGVIPLFGTILILVSIPSQIGIMSINAYGAMLTSATAVDGFTKRGIGTGKRTRIAGVVTVMVIAVAIALILPDDYLNSFNNFLLLMLYFLVPWTAVNLVDFYFVRKGNYAITEIFNPAGLYGRWGWRGLTSYIVGLLAMVPFMSVTFFTGPVALLLNYTDISFIVGLVIAGGLYYLFSRGINLEKEGEIVRKSQVALVAMVEAKLVQSVEPVGSKEQ